MDLVQVHVIRAQAPQAVVDRVADVLARQAALIRVVAHGVENFGGDDHPVALRKVFQRPSQHLFASACRIHVGGVEKIDPQLERAPDERPAFLLLEYPLAPALVAVGHGAQAEARHFEPRASEIHVLHISLEYHAPSGISKLWTFGLRPARRRHVHSAKRAPAPNGSNRLGMLADLL